MISVISIKPCYNKLCYQEVQVYMFWFFSDKVHLNQTCETIENVFGLESYPDKSIVY